VTSAAGVTDTLQGFRDRDQGPLFCLPVEFHRLIAQLFGQLNKHLLLLITELNLFQHVGNVEGCLSHGLGNRGHLSDLTLTFGVHVHFLGQLIRGQSLQFCHDLPKPFAVNRM